MTNQNDDQIPVPPKQITDLGDVEHHLYAGHAHLTLLNTVTQERATFEVLKPEGERVLPITVQKRFVFVTRGDDSLPLGELEMVNGRVEFSLDKGTTRRKPLFDMSSPEVAALLYIVDHVSNKTALDDHMQVWHTGRCGRCGKQLYVPVYKDLTPEGNELIWGGVKIGIGPKCGVIMGLRTPPASEAA